MIDWQALGEETIDLLREALADTRVHGNDERLSLENLALGARGYTEMPLAVAGA